MKARWYLVLGLGLSSVLFLFFRYGQTTPTRSWETSAAPTDKPAVNFVISLRDDGVPILQRVWLCAEEPRSGKLIKRAMDFEQRSAGCDQIAFEFKEDPGDLLELALPPVLGGSFRAELKSRSTGTSEALQFDEVR